MLYKLFIRPIFFAFNPEGVHNFVFSILSVVNRMPWVLGLMQKMLGYKNPSLERTVAGIKFSNPVGIAAGLDKDAEAFDAFGSMGFSHIEIGTVTPKAQPGNPKPRLYRVVADGGLINRMGFNNEGVEEAVKNLRHRYTDVVIGGNIGKNKITPENEAVRDYELCFEALYPYVDYFAVNISSPNTPNLRQMQNKEPLMKLLSALKERNDKKSFPKPIFLKIAPDLSFQQIDEILEVIQKVGIEGIIATNTTISRERLSISQSEIEKIGAGGLSGKPLTDRSTEVIRYISEQTKGRLPIIGIGGIMTPQDAIDKLQAGASLVQLYSGFIYGGPSLVGEINKRIAEEIDKGNLK